jgi:hypothetical protein
MEPLASNSLKPCKICMGSSGTESCLDCQQYFCGSCKSWYKIIDEPLIGFLKRSRTAEHMVILKTLI